MSDPRINAFWQRQGDTPTSDEVVAEVDHEARYCDADNPLGGPMCGRLVSQDRGGQRIPHDGLHEATGADGALYRWGTRQLDQREHALRRIAKGMGLPLELLDDVSYNHWVIHDAAVQASAHQAVSSGDYVVDADADGDQRPRPEFRAELTAEEVRRVLHRYAVQNGADEANAMGISTQLEYLARSGAVNARDGIARYDTYKLIHRDRDVWPWWRRVLATVAAHPDGPQVDGVEVVYDDVVRFVERVLTEHAADRVDDLPEEVRHAIYRYARQNGADDWVATEVARVLEQQAADPNGTIDTFVRNEAARQLGRTAERHVWPWWNQVVGAVERHPDGPHVDGVEVVYDDVLRFLERVLVDHAADRVEDPPTFTRGEVVACLARWAQQEGASELWADEIAERFTHLIAGAAAHPDRRGSDLGTIVYDALEYHLGHGQLSEQVDGALWLLGSAGRLLQRGATHSWGGGGGPEGQTSLIPAAPTTVPPGSPYVIVTTREGHLP